METGSGPSVPRADNYSVQSLSFSWTKIDVIFISYANILSWHTCGVKSTALMYNTQGLFVDSGNDTKTS